MIVLKWNTALLWQIGYNTQNYFQNTFRARGVGQVPNPWNIINKHEQFV
jgi:hypothetical protein